MSELAASGGRDEQLAYRRVADDIASRISSGELTPGTRLLAERQLAEHYGVSFGTIRHAIRILREQGLVITHWGRGNYVAGPTDVSGQ